jgi:predicted TIM-barrel fold metal-dependent hydrolase
MPRIDIHTRFQCLDFVKHLLGRRAFPRSVLDGGTYAVECAFRVPALAKIIDMDAKLRDLEAMDIAVSVLSHGLPLGPDVLGGAEADDWAKRINDDLARIIAAYPGKFVGFGTIGFGNPQRAIAEVDRCITQLGFKGIQLFSNIAGKMLDAAEHRPVLQHIGRMRVPVHLHPAIPLGQAGLDSPGLALSIGFPYDASLNTLRLILSGVLDEHPALTLIVAHTGGVLPYLKGRIEAYCRSSPLVTEPPRLSRPIGDYLANLYVDTVCYHHEALACCYQVLGAERLLFGTDHPFGAYQVPAELVDRLDCPSSHRDMIYHGNAERLLSL